MGCGPLGGVLCGMRGERYTLYPKDLALILASPPLSLWSVSVLAPLSSCAHPTRDGFLPPAHCAYRFLGQDACALYSAGSPASVPRG